MVVKKSRKLKHYGQHQTATFLLSSRNYVVEKRDKQSGDWVRCAEGITGTEVTIGKLKEGHEYEFRVMAENANGLSEPLVTDQGVVVKNPFSMLIRLSNSFEMNDLLFLNS